MKNLIERHGGGVVDSRDNLKFLQFAFHAISYPPFFFFDGSCEMESDLWVQMSDCSKELFDFENYPEINTNQTGRYWNLHI